MPRLSKTVPSYCKHRASGQAIVTLNGRDHYLGPYGSKASRFEYDRLICEWIAGGRSLPAKSDGRGELTVVELIAGYVDYLKATYPNDSRHATVPVRAKPVLSLLRQMYGRELAKDFGPLKLKAIRQKLISKGDSRGYINENVRRIQGMFRWGTSEELVHPDVLRALESVTGLRKGRTEAREGKKVQPVELEVVEATLTFLPDVVADMLRLQLLLGCRPSELFAMRPGDICRDADVWVYRPSRHKNDHRDLDRAICIGPRAQEILRPYLLRGEDVFCFSPAESERKRLDALHVKRKTPLSCGNRPGLRRNPDRPRRQLNTQYDADAYRRAVARACDAANVARWSPYQLRHARATEIRKSHGLEGAQVVLGHANAKVTQIYAERDLNLAAKIAREVG